ncbi:MAG: thiamine pyrophosphate-dependent enzyme, partial [Gammaproteobacteria bacterium]|nr:thiamine pyrophosphate-dependent enzyme [Gammaproteobacteria bacterium]
HDYVACGFDRADVVITVGYDMVEYHPHLWHAGKDKKIIHIDMNAAEVDEHYILECGVVGDINAALENIATETPARGDEHISTLRATIVDELGADASDAGFPIKPQKIIWDLREVLAPDDIVISDVGAHKMWMARMYQAERPNTCIISNGFASMGIAVPGVMAAKLAFPDRKAVAVTGDAGFLMNSQEIETMLRHGVAAVILVWTDSEYGLIKWHQLRRFGRETQIGFTNPDLVKYADSFGAKGYRIENTSDLKSTLEEALNQNTLTVIDCPVDYSENMRLTEKLGNLVCPV